jgi:hypothetical protein
MLFPFSVLQNKSCATQILYELNKYQMVLITNVLVIQHEHSRQVCTLVRLLLLLSTPSVPSLHPHNNSQVWSSIHPDQKYECRYPQDEDEDQGEEPRRGAGRGRDDPDHLAGHQGQANLPVPRHRPQVLRPGATVQR